MEADWHPLQCLGAMSFSLSKRLNYLKGCLISCVWLFCLYACTCPRECLQEVVSCHVGAENQTQALSRNAKCSYHRASAAPSSVLKFGFRKLQESGADSIPVLPGEKGFSLLNYKDEEPEAQKLVTQGSL